MLIDESFLRIEKLPDTDDEIDRERMVSIGESGLFAPFTDDPGQLFRSLRQEYGRCTGKVYVDGPDGKAIAVGWVFRKLDRYSDARRPFTRADYYLREVWVTLYDRAPERTVKHFYHRIDGKAA